MRILFIISSLQIGGEQRVASILTDGFVKNGVEVDILVLGNNCEKQFEFNSNIKINYLNVEKKKFKNIIRIFKINKQTKKCSYDVIIGFAVIPAILSSITSIFCKVPVVICERNDPSIYSFKYKVLRFLFYRFAKGAVFQTSDAKLYFKYLRKTKSIVIQNPLNIEKMPEPFFGSREKVIVNTSRLVDSKRQEVLIKAFKALPERFNDYKLEIYGDGPKKSELEKLISDEKLENRVFIYNATTDILSLINKYSLFVLASEYEGFPNSLAEALALGIPCISTDCRIGGPRDMIKNGENGFLVKVGDIKQMSEAMIKILSDNQLQTEFSKESLKIREKLSAEKIVKSWLTFMSGIKE